MFALVVASATSSSLLRAADPPPGLPRYDVKLTIDTGRHRATVREVITWTNRSAKPTKQLVVNFYPHYRIPEGDYLLLAKTLELLRLNPSHGIDRDGRHGVVDRVTLREQSGRPAPADTALGYQFRDDNPTAIEIDLPAEVGPGQGVTVEIDCTVRLPNKQGRWGHWQGVTFLANTLPVVAFHDDAGWHAMPFVPWHQPFWNEAGVYTASIRLPADEKLACPAAVKSEAVAADGWKEVVTEPFVGRDFAVVCSKLYQEYTSSTTLPDGRVVQLRCLAYPKHEFYAKEILRIVGEAIPVYSRWFGPYPYPQFTVAESFFGWNGNECAGMVLIDERVFGMPQLGKGYVEYLVSHETCHQWWYNLVGTNGYAETFLDEGAATYFTHRMLDRRHGKNNPMLFWPKGVEWLPNMGRENYRYATMMGAIRKDEMPAAAGDLPGFNHLIGLFTGAYDRGSKVYGMIEDRLGEAAFLDFVQELVAKYSWRVLSAAQLRAELEAYTGRPWGEFFERWVYGKGLTDWSVESVAVDGARRGVVSRPTGSPTGGPAGRRRVSVVVRQRGEYDEPTTVGVQLAEGGGFPVRVPVPGTGRPLALAEHEATVEPLGDGRVRVELTVPSEPVQVAVDPDGVLLDKNPGDNVWRKSVRLTAVPLYTMLNETDLTNDYDRWNAGAGPWIGGALYPDPWYTRSSMAGVRAGVYRTQEFNGGVYAAVRSDYRDLVVGADGLLDHWPHPKTQFGYNVEHRVAGPWGGTDGRDTATRAAVFGRYVLNYGSSLYLPPIQYVEAFGTYQDNFLPFARPPSPGAVRPEWTQLTGLHYRLNLYTPYWDAERGVWVDLVYGGGVADIGYRAGTHQLRGELAAVRKLPDWCLLGPLSNARVAGRVVSMGATPDRGQFFALGGGTLFRGFDLAERQGSFLWVGNVELRLPLFRDVTWDVLDRVAGGRNLWLALLYDVGAIYSDGRQVGEVAHALGAGLRLDIAFFSFIERATLRLDAAKTVNAATPTQIWFGVQHPF